MRARARVLLAALAGLALSLALVPGPTRADAYLDDYHPHQTYWAAGWDVAIPVTSLRSNWVQDVALQGGQFEFRIGVVGRLSVGTAVTWNWLFQNLANSTSQSQDVTATGAAYHRLSATQARVTVHYYFTQSTLQPYVGVGLGLVWTGVRNQIATLDLQSTSCYLAASPEAGLLLNVLPKFALYAVGRYQWTQASFFGVQNAQWVSVQVGVAAFL